MIDQFEPWYFGVAFAFCFKFCTGMPDAPAFLGRPRHRRPADAPRVELPAWVRLISRRVEQQLKRDWLLGFSMGSFLFMYTLNACRTAYSFDRVQREDGTKGFDAKELEEGSINICDALAGKYRDASGNMQAVAGDMTQARWCRGVGFLSLKKTFNSGIQRLRLFSILGSKVSI